MRRIALILLLLAGPGLAGPPEPSSLIGDIKRDASGKLIVVQQASPASSESPPPPPPAIEKPAEHKHFTKPKIPPPANTVTTTEALPAQRQPFIDNTPPQCAVGAITCIEVVSMDDRLQASVPLTFGQPFKAGDLPKGIRLEARDRLGGLPIQMDEESSHLDGSIRFAVLSLQVGELKGGEKRVVSLFPASSTQRDATRPARLASSFDIRLVATLYSPQITQITLGNRNGNTPGIPFEAGERITLILGSSSDEKFLLTVPPELAGGHFSTLTKLAEALTNLINSQSREYRAYKIGEAGGYENLWVTTHGTEDKAFSVRFDYAGKARFTTTEQQSFHPPRRYEALAKPALEHLIQSGAKPRLQGPIAKEYAVLAPFVDPLNGTRHPQLTTRLHARFLDNGQRVRTDVVLENNWAYEPDPGNLTYDLTVTQGSKTLFWQPVFTHYHHARWHKVIWSQGEAPKLRVRHHMPYFLASRATWNYDLSLRIPSQVLAEEDDRLSKVDTHPMGAAFLTQEFGSTGGRPEIGPLPRWAALYLISQDPRAEKALRANADAAAGVPIHYRDRPTDLPVSLDDHPRMTFSDRHAAPKDRLPKVRNGLSPWRPDLSHQGSFAYLPYLLTGDLFYQEEIQFWAAFNMFAIYPENRGNGKGLISQEQIRGQAWALRSIGEASRTLPDRHPQKGYYQKRLTENLNWYVERYSNPEKSGVSPLGCIVQGDKSKETAPWQIDFMTLVVAHLAENNEPLAQKYLPIISRCTTERWTSEERGFCRQKSAGYWIRIRHDNGQFMQDWPEVFRANWPEIRTCQPDQPLDGHPGSPSGYVAYARAALASADNLGMPGAGQAYRWLAGQTSSLATAFAHDPTWAIVPRNTEPALTIMHSTKALR